MRGFLIAVVVVALIVVGADITGRLVAQHQASKAIAAQLHTADTASTSDTTHTTDPAATTNSTATTSVRIHGWSFLVQAVRGEYSSITISADDVTVGPLTGVALSIDLTDVTLPLSDALTGDLDSLKAASAQATARIPADALATALHQPGLKFSYQTGDSADVTTTIAVRGRTFPVTVNVTLRVVDGQLYLAATPVTTPGSAIPADALQGVAQRLSATIPLSGLPFPLQDASVSIVGNEVVIAASATDISARQLGLAPA